MTIHTQSPKILFRPQTVPDGRWQLVNDDVMGGASSSSFHLSEGVGVFQGNLSRANNGGFASVRLLLPRLGLAGMDAILVQLRGDGRRYKFTLRTDLHPNSPIYQCGFATKQDEWEEHRMSFQQFVATFRGRSHPGAVAFDPAEIVAGGFLISDQQEGPFHLEIACIEAMTNPQRV